MNHNILQPVTDLDLCLRNTKNKQLISAFNFELLHIKVSSPCKNRKLTAPLKSIFVLKKSANGHSYAEFYWILPAQVYSAESFWCINTWRPRQNCRHFPDDIFKCIFFNENVLISINISLKFVPKGKINNIPALA